MKGRARFKQIDITRAVKGAEAAGVEIERIEIEGEKFVIYPKGQGIGDASAIDKMLGIDK